MYKNSLQIFNYSFKNSSNGVVDIFVDGDIVDASTQDIMKSWWGDETSVSYKSFRDQLTGLSFNTVNVYINSTGGHVGDAMAIHDYLNEVESKGVTVKRIGRGIIASAATYILMGNNSEMSENSFFMIHNIQMSAYGDIDSVENQVKTGRKFNDKIVDFYVTKTGNSKSEVSKWMNAETWMTSEEAKNKGFVQNITPSVMFNNKLNSDAFPYKNSAIFNQYNSQIKNEDMTDKISTAIENGFANLLKRMGISNKSEEADTKNALMEFTNSISLAIKDSGALGVTEAKVGELINAAVTDFIKKDEANDFVNSTEVTTIVDAAIKDTVKKGDIAALVNKSDLLTFKNEMITAITEKTGGKSSGEGKVDNKENKGIGVVRKLKNRFAGISYEDVKAM